MLESFFANSIVAIVVLLGALVFIHELGHFLVGKFFGVGVEVFSIGFGPKIFGFNKSGTNYQISIIPLGGYVKFLGSHPFESYGANEQDRDEQPIEGKALLAIEGWKRILILAAGPAANFFLALAIYFFMGMSGIEHTSNKIGMVKEGSPAESAGILTEDTIISIDGKKIDTFSDLQAIVSKIPNKKIKLKVERDGAILEKSLTTGSVNRTNINDEEVEVGIIGVAGGYVPARIYAENNPFHQLKTGDVIEKLEYAGKSFKFISFYKLKDLMETWLNDPTGNLTVSGKRDEKAFTYTFQPEDTLNVKSLDAIGIHSGELAVQEARGKAAAHFKKFDRILEINGEKVGDVFDYSKVVMDIKDPTTSVTVQRKGDIVNLEIPLEEGERQLPSGRQEYFYLDLDFLSPFSEFPYVIEKYENPLEAFGFAVGYTLEQSTVLFKAVGGLIIGTVPLKAIGGPVSMAKYASDAAKAGLATYFTIMALLSINLCVVNLVPIPVLDGGQIMIVVLEMINRGRLKEKTIENFYKLGFILIVFLIVLATYNDLSRFWVSFIKGFGGS